MLTTAALFVCFLFSRTPLFFVRFLFVFFRFFSTWRIRPNPATEERPNLPPPRIFFVKLLPIVRPVELERQYKAMEHNRSTAPGDRWCTSRFRLFRKPYEGLVFRGEPSFK